MVRSRGLTGVAVALTVGVLTGPATAHAAGVQRTVPVADRGDVSVSVTQIQARPTSGRSLRRRARSPRVVISNRAALPPEFLAVARVVRVGRSRGRFAVTVVQVFRRREPGGAAPARLSLAIRPARRRGVRYEFRGAPQVAHNISEELVASSRSGTPPAVGFGPGARAAQIDVGALIRAIVCPILNQLANGPLGGFIGPVINSLRVAFGCTPADPPFADVAEREGLNGGDGGGGEAPPPPAPAATAMSLSCPERTTRTTTTFNGVLEPAVADAPVTLTYRAPSGATTIQTVQTDASGAFADSFSPNLVGSWTLEASFSGRPDYQASSASCAFTVRDEGGGNTGGTGGGGGGGSSSTKTG